MTEKASYQLMGGQGGLAGIPALLADTLKAKAFYLPDDNGDLKQITATADDINSMSGTSVPADDSITNAKMATDVKIGSLAALSTTLKTSIQAALNEVDGHADAAQSAAEAAQSTADAAYVKPEDGIPSTDMTAAVQASLGKADTAIQPGAGITRIVKGVIQLNGWTKTPIVFQDDTPAAITGISAPVDMSTPGNGGTIKITVDSEAEDTATLNCAAGYHTGGGSASQDMTAELDTKFKIAVDGGAAQTVTCAWAGCNSGEAIAAQMQTAIRAVTGGLETVAFSVDHYVITSTRLGTGSSIVISRADDHDACDDLDIGPNGVSTPGTGDCANVLAVTPDEIATLINGDIEGVTADASSGTLIITSNTAGRGSRVLAGNGTLNTLCGIPQNEVSFGAIGLGESEDWGDALYQVNLTLKGTAAAAQGLAWNTPATAGFDITCETTSKTDYVSVLVIG